MHYQLYSKALVVFLRFVLVFVEKLGYIKKKFLLFSDFFSSSMFSAKI